MEEIFDQQTVYKGFFFFIFTNFWFFSIIYHSSIFFELSIVFIFMFFVQVSYKIISFSWLIIRTTSTFNGFTFVVYLVSKIWRFFRVLYFYTSVIVPSFTLFQGLTGSWIGSFLITKVSWVLFILFSRLIKKLYSVIPARSSPLSEKPETSLLSLRKSISLSFSILVLY